MEVQVWSGAIRRRKGLWGIDLRNILITWRLAAKYCCLDLYIYEWSSERKGKNAYYVARPRPTAKGLTQSSPSSDMTGDSDCRPLT